MARDKNMLIEWLREAYALESSVESLLERQVQRTTHWPELHRQIRGHLEETRDQQTRLKECITRLGADTSMVKEMVAKFSASMQALSSAGGDDAIIQACIDIYSMECREVATYRCLIVAADVYDEPEIRRICSEILVEEETIAEWLKNNIAEMARIYLHKTGVPAQPSKPGPERRHEPPRPSV